MAQSVHRRHLGNVDEFHRQIVRANVVELADIGMIQRRNLRTSCSKHSEKPAWETKHSSNRDACAVRWP
jgi:hypothetical protein